MSSKLKNLHISSSSSDDFDEHDAEKAAALFSDCPFLEDLKFKIHTPEVYGEVATLVNNQFILTFLRHRLPMLKDINLQGFSLRFPDLMTFIRDHESLRSAAFSHNCFCILGEYDDGVNDKEGRHAQCVQDILREATGLSNIVVSHGMVCQWRAREAPLQYSDDDDSEGGRDQDDERSDSSDNEGEGEGEDEDDEDEDGSNLNASRVGSSLNEN